MPSYEETDSQPSTPRADLHKTFSNGSPAKYSHTLPVPGDDQTGPIEVPASRSSSADSEHLMHSLSMEPSQASRRGYRNSFGTSLPIPRAKRQSRLSSVTLADAKLARPGMPAVQASREILSSQVQDMSS